MTTELQSDAGLKEGQRFVTFDDNRIASEVFGQFDQNLALIEQRLGISAAAHGNHITLTGSPDATAVAEKVLAALEVRAQKGNPVTLGDVDGALRIETSRERASEPVSPRVDGYVEVSTRKKTITARTETQNIYLNALKHKDLVFGTGPAGTGKTYLAVAHAAAMLERGEVDRIILSRPAVEAGERLGFLPGDMKDKVDPYLRPLYDALYDMIAGELVERYLQQGTIEIAPLAFMRGRTLSNAVVILDEAQNTTSMQMKMFLTRLGENGRMVVTGDPSQIDLPKGQQSGLVEALRLLRKVKGVEVVTFKAEDVVRHPLVQRIVEAYDSAPAERAGGQSTTTQENTAPERDAGTDLSGNADLSSSE